MPSVYEGLHHPKHWPVTGGHRGHAPTIVGAIRAARLEDHVGQSDTLMVAANAAFAAMSADVNYCRTVGVAGSPTNVAVHHFKQAWNASPEGQGNKIPYNGQYDDQTATALQGLIGGGPAACAGGVPSGQEVAYGASSSSTAPHYTPGAPSTSTKSASWGAVASQTDHAAPKASGGLLAPSSSSNAGPLQAGMFSGSWWMWVVGAAVATVVGYVGVKRGWFEMGHYAK